MAISIPGPGVGRDGIYSADIANAIAGLRLDRIVSVKWDITPSVGIVAKDIQKLAMDIRSFRAPLAAVIKTVMIPSIKANFDADGRPPWEALSSSTVLARGGSSTPILRRTGRFYRRATQFNIWTITTTSATVRGLPSDAYYGAFHQSGASRSSDSSFSSSIMNAIAPPNKLVKAVQKPEGEGEWVLPQREWLMWQEDDLPKIDAVFYAWMEERAIRSGKFRVE